MGRAEAFKLMGTTPTPPPPGTVQPENVGKVETQISTETIPQEQPNSEAQPAGLESSKIALFAKKEAKLLKQQEEYKKQYEEWKKQKEHTDALLAKEKEFNDLAAKDKIAALKMIGWSDTDIMNVMAGIEPKEQTPEEKAQIAAQAEIKKLRDELEQKAKDTEKRQNEGLVQGLKDDIKRGFSEGKDKFKAAFIEGDSAYSQAYEFIEDEIKKSGELISTDEALQMTEDLYMAKFLHTAEQLGYFKKEEQAQPIMADTKTPEQRRAPISNIPQPKQQQVKLSPSQSLAKRDPYKPLSHDDKRDQLINWIKAGGLRK